MRLKMIWFACLSLLVMGIAVSPVSGLFESDNFIIKKNTLSSGGSSANSDNFSMISTIGQTSCIGRSSRGSVVLHAGFWVPENFEIRPKALPFIPLLLLDD